MMAICFEKLSKGVHIFTKVHEFQCRKKKFNVQNVFFSEKLFYFSAFIIQAHEGIYISQIDCPLENLPSVGTIRLHY